MNRALKIFVCLSIISAVVGTASTAGAQDPALNRDRQPSSKRFASAGDHLRTRAWLEGAGLSSSGDSFMDGLFHLAIGVGYPINPTMNFNLSAGTALRFGISF